jgi:hypothetical protein
VIAEALSEQAKEDMDKAARSEEDRILLALENNSAASLADLAATQPWGLTREAGKSKVWRIVGKLIKARLAESERGRIVLTNKGTKAVAKLHG